MKKDICAAPETIRMIARMEIKKNTYIHADAYTHTLSRTSIRSTHTFNGDGKKVNNKNQTNEVRGETTEKKTHTENEKTHLPIQNVYPRR